MSFYKVYVIRLNPAVGKIKKIQKENPNRKANLPCVYVGQSCYEPEERFKQHIEGIRASRYVKKYGEELIPELYLHLRVYKSQQWAKKLEREVAEELRIKGYTVVGGH